MFVLMILLLFILLAGAMFIVCRKLTRLKDSIEVTAWTCSIGALLSIAIVVMLFRSAVSDTELLNGYVTSKEIIEKDCLYPGWYKSSDPFCTNENTRQVIVGYRQVCNAENKCHTEPIYETEYSYDYPWERKYRVNSTLTSFSIERVDRQGAQTPNRYTIVQIGEPVSTKNRYKNLLKISGLNIINPQNHHADENLMKVVPPYPDNIYDKYRIDRLVRIGVNVENLKMWNESISEANSQIGPRKQGNFILVLYDAGTYSVDMRDAIYKVWNGGRKNDIIVILGIKDKKVVKVGDITFLNGLNNEKLSLELRKLEDRELEPFMIKAIASLLLVHFDRVPMKTISYIEDSYDIPLQHIFLSTIPGILIMLIVLYNMYRSSGLYKRRR